MRFNLCALSLLALCTISSALTVPRSVQDSIVARDINNVSILAERATTPTPTPQVITPVATNPAQPSAVTPAPTPTGRTPIKDKQLGRVFMYVGIGLGAVATLAMIGGAIAGMRWLAQTKKCNDMHKAEMQNNLRKLRTRQEPLRGWPTRQSTRF
ncbi:hypothetical protein HYFRA_00004086 [Hymenoscyphus fraxineus]|uniref:Transmembrane protein n=1 Tax=Hymenoscyphus fraxineus TaxID=746836 RepID=A0A9N9PNJ4_9HELO|nr:hypothetical protein HYFRA_00004086 [Hymenoscyphus fraxineus]